MCSLPRLPKKVLFLVTPTRTWQVALGISVQTGGRRAKKAANHTELGFAPPRHSRGSAGAAWAPCAAADGAKPVRSRQRRAATMPHGDGVQPHVHVHTHRPCARRHMQHRPAGSAVRKPPLPLMRSGTTAAGSTRYFSLVDTTDVGRKYQLPLGEGCRGQLH